MIVYNSGTIVFCDS